MELKGVAVVSSHACRCPSILHVPPLTRAPVELQLKKEVVECLSLFLWHSYGHACELEHERLLRANQLKVALSLCAVLVEVILANFCSGTCRCIVGS